MNLHEYQAKALFHEYGLPVSTGQVVQSTNDVPQALAEIGGDSWVAKVQVHTGGRGKA
ncbi:MAG: succinate--CoA ligase subunit beta, partial [Gammaproteobacteria bacterium]|nr:succinate--CoA ligase subunit beta [Gammaproteobacteria bacterium]